MQPAALFLHPIPHGKLFKAAAGYNRITRVSQGFEINVVRRPDQVAYLAALGDHVAEVRPFVSDLFEIDFPAALVDALRASHGNQSRAAAILGVSRITVWRWIKKYNLDLDAVLKS